VGIAGAGLMREIDRALPEHLGDWWTPDVWCPHSAQWWRRHWERTGIVDVEVADSMPDGWLRWLDWHRAVAPETRQKLGRSKPTAVSYLGTCPRGASQWGNHAERPHRVRTYRVHAAALAAG